MSKYSTLFASTLLAVGRTTTLCQQSRLVPLRRSGNSSGRAYSSTITPLSLKVLCQSTDLLGEENKKVAIAAPESVAWSSKTRAREGNIQQ